VKKNFNLNIILLSPSTFPLPPAQYGGIERVVSGLSCELAARGHEITVVAPEGSRLPAVSCVAWPENNTNRLRDLFRKAGFLRQVVLDRQPDLVHNFSRTAYLIGLFSLKFPIPLIESYGVLPTAAARLPVLALGSRLTLTGCSEWIARRGREIVGGRWRAIYNFVDVNLYKPTYSVKADAPLVFLSRVDKIKGTDWAIQIAKKTGRRLIIAGNLAASGSNAEFWHRQIQPKLIPGQIEYVGPVDDRQKNELLGRAAALLVPVQWDEPFGLVFTEALACGTPVISCPRGSLVEIVRPGLDGFLGSTVDELCAAVSRLETIDRRACRRRAEKNFSLSKIADDYEALYCNLIEGE
jgi:glycosyltransferase involved in cell wall biosynthesis